MLERRYTGTALVGLAEVLMGDDNDPRDPLFREHIAFDYVFTKYV